MIPGPYRIMNEHVQDELNRLLKGCRSLEQAPSASVEAASARLRLEPRAAALAQRPQAERSRLALPMALEGSEWGGPQAKQGPHAQRRESRPEPQPPAAFQQSDAPSTGGRRTIDGPGGLAASGGDRPCAAEVPTCKGRGTQAGGEPAAPIGVRVPSEGRAGDRRAEGFNGTSAAASRTGSRCFGDTEQSGGSGCGENATREVTRTSAAASTSTGSRCFGGTEQSGECLCGGGADDANPEATRASAAALRASSRCSGGTEQSGGHGCGGGGSTTTHGASPRTVRRGPEAGPGLVRTAQCTHRVQSRSKQRPTCRSP